MDQFFTPIIGDHGAGIKGRFGLVGVWKTLQTFDYDAARDVIEAMKAELDECLEEIEEEGARLEREHQETARTEHASRRRHYYATR